MAVQLQQMAGYKWNAFIGVTVCLLSVLSIAPTSLAKTHHFDWDISLVNFTRNCFTKPLMVVNGQYPGPTIDVTEGDRVVVNVTNNGNWNVTLHWHGIRQMRSCWMDGTAYITECPIRPGNNAFYDFIVSGQRGTTFWHAHVSWTRASVHGAFITRPRDHKHPFPEPHGEIPVILGEWWNEDVVQVEQQALDTGSDFPIADALTMNGWPGTLYNCSHTEGSVSTVYVKPGKTYLLRLINAALNTEMFFSIANHSLTVVEVDSNYVKPFKVDEGVVVALGSYMNVLVTTNQDPGMYYMVGKSHNTVQITDLLQLPPPLVPQIENAFPLIPTTGIFQYNLSAPVGGNDMLFPELPEMNDIAYSENFWARMKALLPANLNPSDSVRHLFFSVGVGTEPCNYNAHDPCSVPQAGYRPSAMLNNISWVTPSTAILQAYYYGIPGVYSPTFPDFPLIPFNYTDAATPPLSGEVLEQATLVTELEYGTVVELVLQNSNYLFFEEHPMHMHGHFFYVLGRGPGNYNATSDPDLFNYYDPPAHVTINVPARGWVAILFKADNPGAWLFHCHVERHMSLGMQMAFIVKDGKEPHQKLPGPKRLNPC